MKQFVFWFDLLSAAPGPGLPHNAYPAYLLPTSEINKKFCNIRRRLPAKICGHKKLVMSNEMKHDQFLECIGAVYLNISILSIVSTIST